MLQIRMMQVFRISVGYHSISFTLKAHHATSSNNGGPTKKTKTELNDNSTPYVFNGTVPSNPLISILEDKLRPYILHFLDSVAIIKLWIQLMIPKVEDGNNFGVSIQEVNEKCSYQRFLFF